MEKIEIKDLSFAYPQKSEQALKNVSLVVKQGEFVTLCGKSGCGKSTLLRQLKPVIAPHGDLSGSILFDGRDIQTFDQREQAETIGYVSQNPDDQIVCDKVWHELAFGLESLSYQQAEIRARVSEMASFFGIQNWFYKNVWELSGGQKQTLNLASVMVMNPSLLILDEPTSQLDPIAAEDFINTLSKINKELGVTVLISEHRLENCFVVSDRVVVMEKGEIIADNKPCNIGKILKDRDSDMQKALPTPIKVFYSKEDKDSSPITVRDGKTWLGTLPINKDIVFDEQKRKTKEIIKLNDIWFRYEKDMPDVLKGLEFSVYENEFYAIVGGNGAGKTTTLSVISGINVPYRGKVVLSDNRKIASLPQNPQSLFVKKTVLLDLYEVFDRKTGDEQFFQEIIDFCELGEYLASHPYDLSGGEMQRVALAKVLLTKPQILLLDEPTKGLDAHFKEKLGGMLKSLQNSGMTIIMVSHDIEFCAEFADRVGMFFDGQITSENTPRKFFSGKNFYTTSANRMARDTIPNAVLCEDIIAAIGGEVKKPKSPMPRSGIHIDSNTIFPKNIPKKLTKSNLVIGGFFLFLSAAVQYLFCGRYDDWLEIAFEITSIVFLAFALLNLVPKKKFSELEVQTSRHRRKIPKRTLVATLMILILIPFTIFFGIYYLGDRKYYFISLLIILETMLPFVMIFEGRKPQAREIVIISVLCAIGVAGRCAFAMLPQFKPVIALVIISGICFGGETGFLVGAITGFVSNMFFGQGPWTPWQMFAFGIIGFLAGILFQKGILRKTKIELCVFGFFSAIFIFGGIMNPASVIMWQGKITKEMLMLSYIQGLPFDLIQAVATVFFLWFAAEPMCEKMERIKIKYGLIE